MRRSLLLTTSAIALTVAGSAQGQLTGTAKWADSASREIDSANTAGDLDRLTTAAAMLDRVLTVTPNDPLLLYYRSLALYRSASLYTGLKRTVTPNARSTRRTCCWSRRLRGRRRRTRSHCAAA